MKTKYLLAVLAILSLTLIASVARADDILCIKSGNWNDPTVWTNLVVQTNQVPTTNDSVDIESPFVVTVNTNAECDYIYSIGSPGGTLVMGAGVTLIVHDSTGGAGTATLGQLDATAVGNTVVYACNPYHAKRCNYYNLVFANTNYVDPYPPYAPWENFNNFSIDYGLTPMTIAGNMTLLGHNKVQQGSGGAPITIGGNLTIGSGCAWDCSGDLLTVASNVYVYGLLEDLNGALGSNYIGGDVIVAGPGTSTVAYPGGPYTNGWYVSDVTQWAVGGSLVNNGSLWGRGYGSIAFEGTGSISGSSSLTLPTMTVDGTYTIATITTLTTNTPTLNGTLVFDLAAAPTNKIILLHNSTNPPTFYYSGLLNVINSGPAPTLGATYTFFSASNYDGAFAFISLPALGSGLSWATNLLTAGSIAVVSGGGGGGPTLNYSSSGTTLTLTWDTTSFPGYSVQAQTNQTGIIGTTWYDAGSGGVSPFVIQIDPANPPVFFRLHHP